MQALPQQVADRLPHGTLRLDTSVVAIDRGGARTADGAWTGGALVVATDGKGAAALTSLPAPRLRGLTTYYHRVETSPSHRAMLHVDGDRRGPV